MPQVEKQHTGFKFGKYRTTLIKVCDEISHNGRTYKLVLLSTEDHITYYALRLYNSKKHFIKQFLFEPEILSQLLRMLKDERGRMVHDSLRC